MDTNRKVARAWFDRKRRGLRNGKRVQRNWSTLETCVLPPFGDLPFGCKPDPSERVQTGNCEKTNRPPDVPMMPTAKRSTESRHEMWELIDEEGSIGTTPERLVKMSRAYLVPIGRQAGAVLDSRRLLTEGVGSIFREPKPKPGAANENAICEPLQSLRPGKAAHGLRQVGGQPQRGPGHLGYRDRRTGWHLPGCRHWIAKRAAESVVDEVLRSAFAGTVS